MSDVATLGVHVEQSGTEQVVQALGRIEAALSKTEQSAVKSAAIMGAVSAATTAAFGAISQGLGGIGSGLSSLVSMNSSLEQATIAFTQMLGSGEKAQAFLADLRDFANTTPFEFPELVDASKKMLAFGFTAQQVRPLLTAVGDAVAGMGGGKAEIERVTLALGQIQAKGHLAGDEMLQLTEAGVFGWNDLAKVMGVDVTTAQDKVSKGLVDSNTAMRAFIQTAGERFPNMMEAQSHTFQGAMSTIHDAVTTVLGGAFNQFFQMLSHGADQLAQFLQTDEFEAWAQAALGAFDSVKEPVQAVFDQIGQSGPQIMAVLGQVIQGAANFATALAQTFASALPGIMDFVGSATDDLSRLGATIGDAFETVGPVLQGVLEPLVGFLGDLAENAVSVAEQLDPMGIAVAGVGAAVVALATGAVSLAPALGAAGVALAAINLPLIAVAGAAAALTAAWVNDFGGIQEVTQQLVDGVGSLLGTLSDNLSGPVNDALQSLGALWDQVWTELQIAAVDAINQVLPVFDQLGAWLSENLPPAVDQLKESWDGFWSHAGPLLEGFWNVAQPIIGVAIGAALAVARAEIELFGRAWQGLVSGIQSIVEKLAPIVGPIAEALGIAAAGLTDKIAEALNAGGPKVAMAAEEVGEKTRQAFVKGASPVVEEAGNVVEETGKKIKATGDKASGAASALQLFAGSAGAAGSAAGGAAGEVDKLTAAERALGEAMAKGPQGFAGDVVYQRQTQVFQALVKQLDATRQGELEFIANTQGVDKALNDMAAHGEADTARIGAAVTGTGKQWDQYMKTVTDAAEKSSAAFGGSAAAINGHGAAIHGATTATDAMNASMATQTEYAKNLAAHMKDATSSLNELTAATGGYQRVAAGGAAPAGGEFFSRLLGSQYGSGNMTGQPGAAVGGNDVGISRALNQWLSQNPSYFITGIPGTPDPRFDSFIDTHYLEQFVEQQRSQTELLRQINSGQLQRFSTQMQAVQNPETGEYEWQRRTTDAFGSLTASFDVDKKAIQSQADAARQAAQAMFNLSHSTVEQANASDMAAAHVQGAGAGFANVTVGTGSALHTLTLQATLAAMQMGTASRELAAEVEEVTNRWKAIQANAAALQANQMVNAGVAGGRTATGLTSTQIYGGTTTLTGPTGPSTWNPGAGGNYYGLPVVSPITPGTLLGHAGGGTIREPSYLVSMRTGRPWGSVAERGSETVTPGGMAGNAYITVYAGMGAGDVLQDGQFWRRAWRDQIAPAAAEHGARV